MQLGCVWKAPSFVEAIPYVPIAGLQFSMPKSREGLILQMTLYHLQI